MHALPEAEESPSPLMQSRNIRRALSELIDHVQLDEDQVTEPRFRLLLRQTAAQLQELRTAFRHYDEEFERSAQHPPAA